MKRANEKETILALLILVLGVAVASVAAIIIRFAQQDAPSLVIAALRLGFASLLITPFAISRCPAELRRLQIPDFGLLVASGLFLALHFGAWITSLEYTSVASSAVLVQTTPLWVAVLIFFLKGDKPQPGVLVGLVATLIGGWLIAVRSSGVSLFQPGAENTNFVGNMLALAGALCMAAYLLIGARLRRSLSLLSYIWVVYSSAAVFLAITVFITGQKFSGFPSSVYLWCLVLAIGPQLIGHTSFNHALRFLPTVVVSVGLLGEPVGSVILAFLIFNQPPTIIEIVGGCLILAGISLASISQVKIKGSPART